jgi:hypothetical protein
VNTPEDYIKAEDHIRNSQEYNNEVAAANAKTPPDNRIEVKKPLEEIYGPDYKDRVSGKTRTGTKNNPTGVQDPDFTDGSMVGRYRRDPDGSWKLVTMYPEPK